MKYAAALASIGLVAAHPHPHHKHHHHCDHHWGLEKYHKLPNPIQWYNHWKGKQPAPKICNNLKDGDRMADNVYFREMAGSMHNYGVKGWYREAAERPISEECWGDWMDAEWMKMVEVGKKAKTDKWSITREDAHTFWDTSIDMHFKNMEAC